MGAGRGRRTGIILIILIILILIVGAGALLFFGGFLGGNQGADGAGNGQQPVAQDDVTPTVTPLPPLNVIVARRDIPRGARLALTDVTVVQWPRDPAPPVGGLILEDEEGAPTLEDLVVGRIARTDIVSGTPIMDFNLTPGTEPTGIGDDGSDAALLIPSGQVAYAIPVDRFASVAYAPRPGDHVDILMSFRIVDVDEDFQTILPNTITNVILDSDLVEGTTDLDIGLILEDDLEYTFAGREEDGPFGSTIFVIPNVTDSPQRARQATQLLVDNAMVLRLGDWPITDIYQPIVVTPQPPPTAVPEGEGEEGEGPPPTPTPTPIPIPDVITLVMGRQDALVLKYGLETGAEIDLVLRSALDDDINEVATDTVHLQYIIDFYGLEIPPKLPIASQPRWFFPTPDAPPAEEETP